MSTKNQKTIFSNDAEIIIVDETVGVTDTTRRPATGAILKMALEYKEKEAKYRRMMEQMKNTDSEAKPTDPDPK